MKIRKVTKFPIDPDHDIMYFNVNTRASKVYRADGTIEYHEAWVSKGDPDARTLSGYYPLYDNEITANLNSPLGSSTSQDIDVGGVTTTFYIPNGVTTYSGDYPYGDANGDGILDFRSASFLGKNIMVNFGFDGGNSFTTPVLNGGGGISVDLSGLLNNPDEGSYNNTLDPVTFTASEDGVLILTDGTVTSFSKGDSVTSPPGSTVIEEVILPGSSDSDGDGTANNLDAFPNDPNEDTDTDGDGQGDNADTDDDGDGIPDTDDADHSGNVGQPDTDGDGTIDSADTDDDGDGTPDSSDAFPLDSSEDTDTDGDGQGDNADTDDDGDGIPDTDDADHSGNVGQPDTDGDGTIDSADTDDDGDGTPDSSDAFPLDSSEDTDTDGDGQGDNADTDDDGDGIPDTDDADHSGNVGQPDTDGDGTIDSADTDDDGDGTPDSSDAFPLDSSEDTDTDGDGQGDNADTDDDGDGTPDSSDSDHPDNAGQTDSDGDGIIDSVDTDDDGDGIPDTDDADHSGNVGQPDTDGDGTIDSADTDDDGDGTPDSSDAFPLDSSEDTDTDGDGQGDNADTDDDGDGTPDSSDAFPLDSSEDTDTDGDGQGDNADADDDGDGIPDTDDADHSGNVGQPDTDGDGTIDSADADDDGDGIPDTDDADHSGNVGQPDTDGDGTIDSADADDDGDGVPDSSDNYPLDPNRASGNDGDSDGVDDEFDSDPSNANPPEEYLCLSGGGGGINYGTYALNGTLNGHPVWSGTSDTIGSGQGTGSIQHIFAKSHSSAGTPQWVIKQALSSASHVPSAAEASGVATSPELATGWNYAVTINAGACAGYTSGVDTDGDGVDDAVDSNPNDASTSGVDTDGDGVDDAVDSDPNDAASNTTLLSAGYPGTGDFTATNGLTVDISSYLNNPSPGLTNQSGSWTTVTMSGDVMMVGPDASTYAFSSPQIVPNSFTVFTGSSFNGLVNLSAYVPVTPTTPSLSTTSFAVDNSINGSFTPINIHAQVTGANGALSYSLLSSSGAGLTATVAPTTSAGGSALATIVAHSGVISFSNFSWPSNQSSFDGSLYVYITNTTDGGAVIETKELSLQFIYNYDEDGDGVINLNDAFPSDPSETTDSDGDGVGDNADGAPNDPFSTTAPPPSPTLTILSDGNDVTSSETSDSDDITVVWSNVGQASTVVNIFILDDMSSKNVVSQLSTDTMFAGPITSLTTILSDNDYLIQINAYDALGQDSGWVNAYLTVAIPAVDTDGDGATDDIDPEPNNPDVSGIDADNDGLDDAIDPNTTMPNIVLTGSQQVSVNIADGSGANQEVFDAYTYVQNPQSLATVSWQQPVIRVYNTDDFEVVNNKIVLKPNPSSGAVLYYTQVQYYHDYGMGNWVQLTIMVTQYRIILNKKKKQLTRVYKQI